MRRDVPLSEHKPQCCVVVWKVAARSDSPAQLRVERLDRIGDIDDPASASSTSARIPRKRMVGAQPPIHFANQTNHTNSSRVKVFQQAAKNDSSAVAPRGNWT